MILYIVMEKTKLTKLTQKWWFWVIAGVVVLIGIGMLSGDSSYYTEYTQCKTQLTNLQTASNDYLDALKSYCVIDYTNPLCPN